MDPLQLIIKECEKPELRMRVYMDAIKYLENGVNDTHTEFVRAAPNVNSAFGICSALIKSVSTNTGFNDDIILTMNVLFIILPEFKEMYLESNTKPGEYIFPLEPQYVVHRIKFLKGCMSILTGVEL